MAEIGIYQTSSSLPKIIKQVASKRKGTKGSLSFFFAGERPGYPSQKRTESRSVTPLR